MSKFFKRLNYSFGNEDWATEHRALDIKSGDDLICITASGDRPMNLLLQECNKIVSVDANPIQNHLLKLKIAAMQNLDYERYIAFLGITEDRHRLECLQKLSKHMDQESYQYWKKHPRMISKGIVFQGAIEKWMYRLSLGLRMVQGFSRIKKLFAFRDLELQKEFFRKEWDSAALKGCFKLFLNPLVSRFIIKDPGIFANENPSLTVAQYFYNQINGALMRGLAYESCFLSLLFLGKVDREALPPYLHEKSFNLIKSRLHRIEIQTIEINEYFQGNPKQKFDGFSLSDVASYISQEHFKKLLHSIAFSAKPNARFCIRECTSSKQIPPEFKSYFNRNYQLEKNLERDDRCGLYKFIVGSIDKVLPVDHDKGFLDVTRPEVSIGEKIVATSR